MWNYLACYFFFFISPAAAEIYTLSYTTLFRSLDLVERRQAVVVGVGAVGVVDVHVIRDAVAVRITSAVGAVERTLDRKSTRLNSSHRCISYAVFCLKKKIMSSSL